MTNTPPQQVQLIDMFGVVDSIVACLVSYAPAMSCVLCVSNEPDSIRRDYTGAGCLLENAIKRCTPHNPLVSPFLHPLL
jgi:hypothetical protein